MRQARAFAPGNLSCVFKIVPNDDPAKMHSLGMGFTVAEGVTVTVRRGSPGVTFNGEAVDFPTVRTVAEALAHEPVRVAIETPLPLGCGFGLSGASALATAYALDALLERRRPREELAMTAHVAEVRNLTGLGDVCAQFRGGWLVKLQEGDPLAAVRTPIPEQPVFYRHFGAIDTKAVLGSPEQKARINCAADVALEALAGLVEAEEACAEPYIDVSKRFAQHSGLLTDGRVQAAIAEAEAAGGRASMVMLGHAVFATVPFPGATQTHVSGQGARALP